LRDTPAPFLSSENQTPFAQAVSWETKLTWQTLVSEGKTLHVLGL